MSSETLTFRQLQKAFSYLMITFLIQTENDLEYGEDYGVESEEEALSGDDESQEVSDVEKLDSDNQE